MTREKLNTSYGLDCIIYRIGLTRTSGLHKQSKGGVNWENNRINKARYKKLFSTIMTNIFHSDNYRHKKTKIYHL